MKSAPFLLLVVLAVLVFVAVLFLFNRSDTPMPENFPTLDSTEIPQSSAPPEGMELATFGSGCFWCTEAVFQQMKGVQKVESGYSGGSVKNPTYRQICQGDTGHAEVVQITFDPKVISYPELLEVFWRSHDPTTPDQQGNDIGPQYRSVIFYHSEQQKQLAERYKRKIDEAAVFSQPVVTQIEPFTTFYVAELDHQNYYATNPRAGYCRFVIAPKVEKIRKVFQDKLKSE